MPNIDWASSIEIKGFIGVSLVDWDGKVSSVIFLPGCNLRCPFCYNTQLVLHSSQMPTAPPEKIWNYLQKNRGWIDGVVITGGEPTIWEDLSTVCQKIKKMGFLVKLDTNGTNPNMVRALVESGLVDYIALDVKAPFTPKKYSKASGTNANAILAKIEQTIQTLLKGSVDYEFRTTLVPTMHKTGDIRAVCEKIKGCKKYALQNFRADTDTIEPSFQRLKPFSNAELDGFLQTARKLIPSTILRK
jgi:pyruvate formate lyase activating enzyme